jgi:cell division protein FtsB
MKGLSRWKWAFAALAAAGFFLSNEGTRSYWKRKRYLKELEARLEEIRASNKNLEHEIARFQNDPRAVEQLARRELGLIQPGEIEYRFVVR